MDHRLLNAILVLINNLREILRRNKLTDRTLNVNMHLYLDINIDPTRVKKSNINLNTSKFL